MEHYLDKLFNPQSIAVIGASDKVSSVGTQVLANLLLGGFSGKIFPVNPRHKEVQGHSCYASVLDITEPVDLAVIIIPELEIPRVMKACGKKNIRQVIILVSILNDKKDRLKQKIINIASRWDIRFIGPDCIAIMCPWIGLNATFETKSALPGNIAFVSQSSSLCTAVLDWAVEEQLGFSAVVSLGNITNISFSDVLDYLALDSKTNCILLFVKEIKHARSFISGLRAASCLKPVIVIHAGRSIQDLHAVSSQTGIMIHAGDVFDIALRRAGAVGASTIKSLFAATEVFSNGLRTQGSRLMIVTNSGSAGMMAADHCYDLNIPLSELSEQLIDAFNSLFSHPWSEHNPINLLANATPEGYYTVIDSCLKEERCDAVLVILLPLAMSEPLKVAEQIVALSRQSNKPILACWMGGAQIKTSWKLFAQHKIPYFTSPETAVEGFSYLANYCLNQQLLLQVPEPISYQSKSDINSAHLIIDSALANGQTILNTAESHTVLQAFGIPIEPRDPTVNDRELMISVVRDPVFGPTINLGIGGGLAGVIQDFETELPPLNHYLIKNLLFKTPVAKLLGAFRNQPAVNREAVENLLLAVSEMVCELPQIQEIDINPLIVNDKEVVAEHARIVIHAEKNSVPYSHMAIHPYPNYLISYLKLNDGTSIIVRPIRPEDAKLEQEFVRHLSVLSKHFRYMVSLHELTPEMIKRTTQIDYDREMSMVALPRYQSQEQIIGIAQYVTNPDSESCEFAIAVADDWRNKGIASHLMVSIIEAAKAKKLKKMTGAVLATNTSMLTLAKDFGFQVTVDAEDSCVHSVVKVLSS